MRKGRQTRDLATVAEDQLGDKDSIVASKSGSWPPCCYQSDK